MEKLFHPHYTASIFHCQLINTFPLLCDLSLSALCGFVVNLFLVIIISMAEPRKINWQQWLFILGFVVSLVIVVIFALRAFSHAPRQRVNEPIRMWMTIPYISHSYHIPEYVLYQALGLPFVPRDRRPLTVIARQQNRTIASVIAALQEAIKLSRPPYPTPLPFPPGTPLPPGETPPSATVPRGPS